MFHLKHRIAQTFNSMWAVNIIFATSNRCDKFNDVKFKDLEIMNVNYSLALMSSKPGDKNAPKKYYAKAQTTGTISMDEMAEEIAYATSLTDGDVLNVLRALIHQLKVKLAGGKIVKMENLGTFQLQLSSIGTEDKKDFNAANITAARIQFRPGSTIKAATRSEVLNFKRVARLTEIVSDEQEKENNQNEEEAPDPRV